MMCQSTTTSSTACCCSSTLSEVQRYFFVRVGSNTFKAPVSIIMYTFISILVIKSLFFLPKSDFKWISDVNFLASGSVFFLTRLDLDPDETYGAIRNTNCFWPMDHVMFLKKKLIRLIVSTVGTFCEKAILLSFCSDCFLIEKQFRIPAQKLQWMVRSCGRICSGLCFTSVI